MQNEARITRARRFILWCSLVLVLVGLADLVYLTDLHVRVNTDPGYVAGCDINATLRCSDVAMSRFSTFAGVPVSVWGIVTYTGYLFFLALAVRGGRARPWPTGLYWLLNVVNLAATIAFALIAELIIGALCIGCIVLYVISPLLFAGATWLLWKDRGALRRDLAGLRRNGPVVRFAAAAAVASLALVFAYPKYWELPLQSECGDLPAGIRADGSCWVGARDPVLEIVEYSDYRCPFCRRAHTQLRDLVQTHRDQIRLVHKHFPLDMSCNPMLQRQLHDQACLMARMAYCAGMQGKFWAMNDLLFSVPTDVSVNPTELASQSDLDVQGFMQCLDTPAAAEHVRADIEQGIELRITGTPTFFVKGEKYVGQIPDEVIRRHLNGAP